MVSYRMIAVAGFLASVSALPLNINLGAYSPALVVGDGEISFGGGQDVTNLMNALEGAAVNAATGTARGATENAASAPVTTTSITPVAAQSIPSPVAETPKASKVPEAPEAPEAPKAPEAPEAPVAPTTPIDPNLEQQATQIAGLQGMGKQIAPRDSESPKAKRDLAGFDRALTYAEAALTKGPLIQLGTGEGGAGVGIIVDNNGGKAGEKPAAKRDESSPSQPRRRTKVTRMYVKRGVPAAIQASSESETRSVRALPVANVPAVAKRESTSSSDTIDAINLNVNDSQGFTMTFVETTEDGEDDTIGEAQE